MARCRRGERPAVSEYTDHYPEFAEQIRELFPTLLVMEDLGSVGGELTGPFAPKAPVDGPVPRQLGEYRILRLVGRGGMGVVYEAVQESLGRHVALKVLPFHAALTGTHLERFRREARAVARLHHTNIVPVFGVGEDKGVHYYAMQFIQGQGLDSVLQELKQLRSQRPDSHLTVPPSRNQLTVSVTQGLLTGQFPEQQSLAGQALPTNGKPVDSPLASASTTQKVGDDTSSGIDTHHAELTGPSVSEYFRGVARVGVQVAEALDYAHRNGVLHRDVKPSNLLLDTQGTVWITDFGLAKAEDSGELTNPGDIVGTLRFMAPERFQGRADPRSDVYSLGITLYEMLTLQPAFDNNGKPQLIERVTHEDPPRPRTVDPHIPRDLETIVLKAVAKEPADRYPTAAALAEDLRRFLADRPIRARRNSTLERTWRWCRRNPAVAGLSGAVALLLVVLGIGFVVTTLLRQERDKARVSQQRAEQAEGETRTLLHRAEDAEREVKIRSHLAQARAFRWSGQVGQRSQSLNELAAAAKLGPSLELRNEAVACLALTDLRRAKSWGGFPSGTAMLAFDARLENYVRSDARGYLSVRRVADDEELATLRGPGSGRHAYFLRFSPDGRFLAAVHDQTPEPLYVWDWKKRRIVLRSGLSGSVDFSSDSQQLVLGLEGSIRLFDLISGQEVKRIPSKEGYHAFAFDPNGRRLAVLCQATNRALQIYDLDSWKIVATLSHTEQLDNPTWSPDGRFLAASSYDRCVYVWDMRTGKQQSILRGHDVTPNALAFSHRGDLCATTGWDGTLRLWETMTGRLLLSVPGGDGSLKPRFSPDDRFLGCTTTGSEVELWEVIPSTVCRVVHVPLTDGEIRGTAFSRDSLLLASASIKGVRLWDWQSGNEVAHLDIGDTRSVLFHPLDGSLFVSGSRGVYCWPMAADVDSPQDLRIGPPRQLAARDSWEIALSADGRSLVVVDRLQGQALVHNLMGGAPVPLGPHPQIARTAISPDGRWVATSTYWGRQSTIKVWNALSGQLVRDLPGEGLNGDARVEFSPDSRWLVAGTPRAYRLYEVGSWEPSHTYLRERASSSVAPVAFTPDSKIVAIAKNARLVQLIDVAGSQELASLASPDPRQLGRLVVSPDGSQLAASCGDGVIQVWDLRSLRQQLAELGLDWDLPPNPPLDQKKEAAPLRATVDLGTLASAAKSPVQNEMDKLRQEVTKQSQAIARNPNDAEAYCQRGRLFLRLQEWSKALDDFNQAITLKPDYLEAYHQRGHAHERLGQAQKAIDDFSAALKGQHQSAHLFHARGQSYLRVKEYTKAVEDLNRALELKLEDKREQANACNTLAWIYVTGPAEFRAPDKALPLAQKAVELAPDTWAFCHTLGVAHYRLGQYKEAVGVLERGVKNNKDQSTAFDLYFLAMCHYQLGDAAKARDCYDRAVAWQKQAKLAPPQLEELNAFRAEAETLLKEANP
jgi:serine/threonine protein kinase/WD40 repeat protein/tetratricopeptide (TPR) repeat protein